jgi:hypothetical protein
VPFQTRHTDHFSSPSQQLLACPILKWWRNDYCWRMKMTVMTSITSKMGLRHVSTTSSTATSISIWPSVGSDAWPAKTRHCIAGHQNCLTKYHAIFSYGDMLRTVFLPPVPQDLPQLQRWITAAFSEIDHGMLWQV